MYTNNNIIEEIIGKINEYELTYIEQIEIFNKLIEKTIINYKSEEE